MFQFNKIISVTVAFGIGALSLSAQTAASNKTDTAIHHMKMAVNHDTMVMTTNDQSINKNDSSKTKPKLVPQTTCPVMTGNPINKKFYADYKGKRVYFCCDMCPATFKKDPEKYLKILEASGQSVETVLVPQTNCPVMGGPINKSIYADYKGKRVYFCCGGCVATFNKSPDEYIKKLELSGQSVEYVSADNSSKK